MTIKVRFFASLAERVGRREAECAHVDGLTVADVWRQITGQDSMPDEVLSAVNHAYSEHATPLADDDEVAYFPPVTGG
ncbi:MAG: MoaD/ThiS family protein [Gammaproteobacteria bacterium]